MTNETFSGISDELLVGVCSTVDSLHLIASTLALGINGLLLFVCFRRPFAVLITRLAANDFLVGAIADTTSAKDEFYCVKNQNGETYFDRIMDYFVDNSATVLVVALSVERLLAVLLSNFLSLFRKKRRLHRRPHSNLALQFVV